MIDRGTNDAGYPTVTFILDEQRPVSVVGDFNDWDPYAHPMGLEDDGLRRATVTITPGTDVHFRYLADGGAWYDDAAADDHDADGGILRAAAVPMPRTADADAGPATMPTAVPPAMPAATAVRGARGTR